MSILLEFSTDGFFLVIDRLSENFLKTEDLGLLNQGECVLFFGHFLLLCDFYHLVNYVCCLGVIVDFSVALRQKHQGFSILFAQLLLGVIFLEFFKAVFFIDRFAE
jgi:hypothetical protein